MKLILENIGMVEHAEISINQLCVIAGENDNGKSTVGKIVFCIIKAINRYKEDLQASSEHQINAALQHLDQSEPPVALVKQEVVQAVKKVHSIVEQPEATRQSIENAFNKVFASEFDASLLLEGATSGSIRLYDSDVLLIHLEIRSTSDVMLKNDVAPIDIKDVTFVESPLIVNHHNLLVRSQSMLDIAATPRHSVGQPYTTLHNKDLFDKLKEPALPSDLSLSRDTTLLDAIRQLIAGEILYDKSSRDFVFKKENNLISIKNTASGIKVFGLLQILLANEVLSKHTMLILDEPENHLHPKWQLQLAQMLVVMVKSGIYILVSSHSPYMIEALKRYSDHAGLKDVTGFFLAENRTIENRNRLGEIFELLAEPFKTFREMDVSFLAG